MKMEGQLSYIGEYSINQLTRIINEYSPKEIFLVRGKSSYIQCGAKKTLDNIFSNLEIHITEFTDFSENPKVEDLEKGLSLLALRSTDLIIGIGGGSVLDMSKLIRFFNSYKGTIESSIYEKKKESIPLIAIPTTAGTGSEATHFAVVYRDKIKHSVAHRCILPNIAIVDPCFTYNINSYLTATTGFDALSQAIEAYWNVNHTSESDIYATKAIKLLWNNLPKVVNGTNKLNESRNLISEGSYYAGKAINITKTTAPHAMSYPFTSFYGFPHGHAVALLFPYFMELNCKVNKNELNPILDYQKYKRKINQMLAILDINYDEDISNYIKNYINNIGLKIKLPNNFNDEIIIKNTNNDRMKNNPKVIKENDIINAIKYIYANQQN